jgi:hypothetical protein
MASQISRRFLSTTARRMQQTKSTEELKKESRRNPEIIVRHKPVSIFMMPRPC